MKGVEVFSIHNHIPLNVLFVVYTNEKTNSTRGLQMRGSNWVYCPEVHTDTRDDT
jgi:hypothetical protein